MIEEPACPKAPQHSYQFLGVEDNGERVHRCGNCLLRKFTDANNAVLRFEEAQ